MSPRADGPSGRAERDFVQRSTESVFGQYVLGDFRPRDLLDTARTLAWQAARQPGVVAREGLDLLRELGRVASGASTLAPPPGDKRFADAAWQQSRVFSRLLQAWVALDHSLRNYARNAGLGDKQAERAQFLMSQVSDALAPTNFLPTNPAAMRQARATRGASVLRGARNFLRDVSAGRPIPSQCDGRPFQVGVTLAATKGAVVQRTEMYELIQYAPQTAEVRRRPILVVPSIVNKYYAFDLAPGRSIFEHFVKKGLSLFVIVWRNPKPEHDHWGIAAYQDAIDSAIDAVRDIAEVDDVHLWGVCGAGPVVTSLAGHYAASGQRKAHSLMLVVSPLDMAAMSQAPVVGAFMDKQLLALAKHVPKKRMSANEFTLLFALLRPNDLIWNYWVNNYLMGKDPPAFDILYWNSDGTGMTAQFNEDFSELVQTNPLVTPGTMTVRGTQVPDLAMLGIDSYVLAAATDHLCLWQGVYRSAQLLGGRSQFVLGNSGHIQTIVCPPGNPKASFHVNPGEKPATAEEWLKTATKHPGSWWDHCVTWTVERSGQAVPAPKQAGNPRHPILGAAPGSYVLERA